MKFNEAAIIAISIILTKTMAVFTVVGYVLTDKDPPKKKKKKEEDKKMGDFSLNGAWAYLVIGHNTNPYLVGVFLLQKIYKKT